MNGLKVKPELLYEILKDRKWLAVLLFDDNRNILVDLEKYSKLRCYLPIGTGANSYSDGFLFIDRLYKCLYRNQDNCVYLIADIPEQKKPEYIKYKIPIVPKFKGTALNDASDSAPSIDVLEIYKKVN